MYSRSDQVAAYRQVVGRMVAAVESGDPEGFGRPSRRLGGLLLGGLMIAAIIASGVVTFRLATGNVDWRDEGAIFLDRSSGIPYVYRDGRLHPTANYTSARLIVGAADPPVRWLRHETLVRAPQGTRLGIEGAPDEVPDPAHLVGPPWTLCDQRVETGPRAVLAIGSPIAGGRSLGPVPSQAAGRSGPLANGVLLRAPDGALYLLWDTRLLAIPDRAGTLLTLGWDVATVVDVTAAFLAAVPIGPALAPPEVDQVGHVGPTVAGQAHRIGQVFVLRQGADPQYYVLLADGLARVTATGLRLLEGSGQLLPVYDGSNAVQLTLDQLAKAKLSAIRLTPEGFPDQVPPLERFARRTVICAAYAAPGPTEISVYAAAPQAIAEASASGDPVGAAPTVLLPGGRAALVNGTDATARWLVTAAGRRYRIPDDVAATALGLGGVVPTAVPDGLLDTLPDGPVLDRAAATRPATVAATVAPGASSSPTAGGR